MTTLTEQEMADAAREVTGHRCIVRNDGQVEILGGEFAGDLWRPEELTRHWKRLVEWLASRTLNMDNGYEFKKAIMDKDINRLQRLVLELKLGR